MLVEVRAIAARSVRRRGMRPLVEATVADATGPMRATFFNQPWLAQRYRPGTRLVLHGNYQGRNRFRVATHATTDEASPGADEVSHYAATEGLSSTQILALVSAERAARGATSWTRCPGGCRARRRWPRAAMRSRRCTSARRAPAETGRRRLAFEELLFVQLALLARRARAGRRRRARSRSTGATS